MLATGRYSQPADIHHLTSGGRRRGDEATISLSPWHHRGLTENGSKQHYSGLYGPSFAHGRRGFQEFFGSDDYLLEVQNVVLAHYQQTPWFNYVPHREVFLAIRAIKR